jgi:hypothetical protein
MENFVQLKKDNILRIGIKTADGVDTGNHLEFDMEDIELPLRLNQCELEHKKNLQSLQAQLPTILFLYLIGQWLMQVSLASSVTK